MTKIRPYFNDHQDLYQGRQPPFYEPAEVSGVSLLEQHCDAIRDELLQVLADGNGAREAFRKWGLKKSTGWRQIELRIYGVDYPRRIKLFPKTMAVIDRIEGASTVYFSVLSPHSRIQAHVGDTDAFYRVHLGLKIPAPLPDCGIEVAGGRRSWQEGKCVAFNDIFCHAAWNETDEERIVLIVDILRPEFRDRAIQVNAGVRAALYYSRLYAIFFPLAELFPRVLGRLAHPALRLMMVGFHIVRSRLMTKS